MRTRTLLTAALVAAAMGCKGESPTGPATPELLVEALSATSIEQTVGGIASIAPAVRVTDRHTGAPLANIVVTFVPISAGWVTFGRVSTDSLGVARAGDWNLATRPGPIAIQVFVNGQVLVVFRAILKADVPAKVFNWTPAERVGLPGEISDVRLNVQDRFNNPISAVELKVSVVDPSGGATESTIVTDVFGVAIMKWKLGSVLGVNSLTVTTTGIEPLVFRATAVDPSTVKWYKLESLGRVPYLFSPESADISEARIGFTSLDGCVCLRAEGYYLTTVKYFGGRSQVSSGKYRMVGNELFTSTGDWTYGKTDGESLEVEAWDPWDGEYNTTWNYKELRL